MPKYIIIALGLCACTVNQTLSEDNEVECASNSECPKDFVCKVSRCRLASANQAPRLVIGAIPRSISSLAIPIQVFDDEGDAVDISARVRIGSAGAWQNIDISGAQQLPSSPEGETATLNWAAAVDLQSFGMTGYVDGIVLELSADDGNQGEDGTEVFESQPFGHGNDSPIITSFTIDDASAGAVSGNIVLRFSVLDNASDAISIDALELAPNGSFSEPIIPIPLNATIFPSGRLVELNTDSIGIEHTVVWNSKADLNPATQTRQDLPGAVLRLRVRDEFTNGESVSVDSQAFDLDNSTSAPLLVVNIVNDTTTTITTDIDMELTITDTDNDSPTVFIAYSETTDDPQALDWTSIFTDSDTVGLNANTPSPHAVRWNIAQLAPGSHSPVWLRFEIQDSNDEGTTQVIGPLDILLETGLDTSAPNYVSPPNAQIFRLSDLDGDTMTPRIAKVLLQWTARAGASNYTVEWVSFDFGEIPDFFAAHSANVNTTELVLDIIEDRDFAWRVRADTTAPGVYSSLGGNASQFRAVDEILKVHCPQATICSDVGRIGNASAPFQKIAGAMNASGSLGITEVRVARRGGSEAYKETVVLSDGVFLRGGYDSSFETQDLGQKSFLAGTTTVSYGATAMVFEGLQASTRVEGFDIQSSGGNSKAIKAFGSPSLRIESVIVHDALVGMRLEDAEIECVDVDFVDNQFAVEVSNSVLDMTRGSVQASTTTAGGIACNAYGAAAGSTTQANLTDTLLSSAGSSLYVCGGTLDGVTVTGTGLGEINNPSHSPAPALIIATEDGLSINNSTITTNFTVSGGTGVSAVADLNINNTDLTINSAQRSVAIYAPDPQTLFSGSVYIPEISISNSLLTVDGDAAYGIQAGSRIDPSFITIGSAEDSPILNVDQSRIYANATSTIAQGIFLRDGVGVITNNEIVAISQIDGSAMQWGEYYDFTGTEDASRAAAGQVFENNLVYLSNNSSLFRPNAGALYWDAVDGVIQNNTIITNDDFAIHRVDYFSEPPLMNIDSNILVAGSAAVDLFQNFMVVGVNNNLMFSGTDYARANSQIYDVFCAGELSRGADCADTGFYLMNAAGNISSASLTATFTVVPDPDVPSTWGILTGGDADIDGAAGQSLGDVGADPNSTGPQ